MLIVHIGSIIVNVNMQCDITKSNPEIGMSVDAYPSLSTSIPKMGDAIEEMRSGIDMTKPAYFWLFGYHFC